MGLRKFDHHCQSSLEHSLEWSIRTIRYYGDFIIHLYRNCLIILYLPNNGTAEIWLSLHNEQNWNVFISFYFTSKLLHQYCVMEPRKFDVERRNDRIPNVLRYHDISDIWTDSTIHLSAYNRTAEIRLDRRSTSNVATNRIQMFPFYLYWHCIIMEP